VIRETAANAERILAHSETGYRLLRGNNFAIANFMNYLREFGGKGSRFDYLLGELIGSDPNDPNVYRFAIEYLWNKGQLTEALALARKLERLCTPPINPRTLYCYRQDLQIAHLLERGQFDPLEEARRIVRDLENAAGARRDHP